MEAPRRSRSSSEGEHGALPHCPLVCPQAVVGRALRRASSGPSLWERKPDTRHGASVLLLLAP
jgi:hypothetical protein